MFLSRMVEVPSDQEGLMTLPGGVYREGPVTIVTDILRRTSDNTERGTWRRA